MDTTNIEQLRTIVIDSVEYIKRGDVLEFYSDLASAQASQFTILTSVLCGIVVVLLGATWWWNYKAAKQQIKDEINTEKEVLERLVRKKIKEMNTAIESYQQKYSSDKGNLQRSINNQINSKYEQLAPEIQHTLEKTQKELSSKIDDYKKSVDCQIKEDQANLNRIFALHCDSTNSHYTAATWWLSAAQKYKETGDDRFWGICINSLNESLQKCSEKDINDIHEVQTLKERVSEIVPDVIGIEKDAIMNRLDELISLKNKSSEK